jgi:hypothetical protein
MRRPLLQALPATLLLLAVAAPASAQRERVIRQAFAPAITPFLGAAGFGVRTVAVSDGAGFDYNNGLTLGVQLDRPLTRRTGLVGTVAVTPLSRVVGTRDVTSADLDRTVVAGLDLGIAGRLKPAAPLFVYVGGGALLATKRAAGDTEGFGAEPRLSAGVGIDLMRFDRAGFRLLYLAHWAKPSTPDDARWTAKSTAFDQTMAVGGRYMLGNWGSER